MAEQEQNNATQTLATLTFKGMDLYKEAHAHVIEELPEELAKLSFRVAAAVEFAPAAWALAKGHTIEAEEEALKATGALVGMTVGATVFGAEGSIVPGAGTLAGVIAGGGVGSLVGEHIMEHVAKQLHEKFGEDSTITVGMMRAALDHIQPHVESVIDAAQRGLQTLDHPTAQRLLDETHASMEQARVAHQVAQNVDINLAAPVLNTMQLMGGSETVVEAAHELSKLGVPSNVSYGKAATDMATVVTMGMRLTPDAAADELDRLSGGNIAPQFHIHTSTAAPGELASQATKGDLGAQHTLLTQSSLVFEPRNEEASRRMEYLVAQELKPYDKEPDWKALESRLTASNQRLADEAQTSAALAQTPVHLSQVSRQSGQASMER